MKKIGQGAQGTVYLKNNLVYKYVSKSLYDISKNIKILNDLINEVYPIYGIKDIMIAEDKLLIIKEYISGNTLDYILLHSDKPQMYLEKMVDLQIEINKVKINLPRKYSDKLKEGLNKLDITNKDIIINKINAIEENYLCHGDFHPQNIIVNNDNLVAIDWDNSVMGNPLLDVARTYLLFEIHSKGVGDIYLDMYEAKTNINKSEVLEYVPFIAIEFMNEEANSNNKELLSKLIESLIDE